MRSTSATVVTSPTCCVRASGPVRSALVLSVRQATQLSLSPSPSPSVCVCVCVCVGVGSVPTTQRADISDTTVDNTIVRVALINGRGTARHRSVCVRVQCLKYAYHTYARFKNNLSQWLKWWRGTQGDAVLPLQIYGRLRFPTSGIPTDARGR